MILLGEEFGKPLRWQSMRTLTDDQPPQFRGAVSVNYAALTADGRNRILTLIELWDCGLRLRWIESPPPSRDRPRLRVPWQVSDDANTPYTVRDGGSSGSPIWMEGAIWITPAVPSTVDSIGLLSVDTAESISVPVPKMS